MRLQVYPPWKFGCHWVIYVSGRGRCEVCRENKFESRPHSKCGVFYAATRKKLRCYLSWSLADFSRYFKDTMMLALLNFVEYLQTAVLGKPKNLHFSCFLTLSGHSNPTFSFFRAYASEKILVGFHICNSVL